MGRTNGEWLEDIEDAIDGLRSRRREIRNQVSDADFEVDDLWAASERRWRRLEAKLVKAENAKTAPANPPRARNVDRLIEAIDEAYYEIELLLD